MRRTMQIRMLAVAIAITFVGGTLGLAFPRKQKEPFIVTAYFTKAIGLFSSSTVRVLGVAVGRVSSVTPEGSKVKVVMKIDPDRKIPADARAVIVPISLIADRYVQLTPVYASGPTLRNGDVIDTDRTRIPAELDDLLAQLKKLLDAVQAGTRENPESIGAAVKNLAAALAGAGDDLSKTLGGAGALSGAVTQNATELDAIVGQLSRLFAALSERRSDLAQLNTRLAQALGAIATERTSLNGTLTNVALLTEQLGSLVKAHRPDLETDIGILAKTTKTLVDRQDSVVRSMDWLHVLADGAENAHNGGALHTDAPVPHIDVRDAHLFPCPPGLEPSVCLLFGLLGVTPPGATGAPSPAAAGPAQGAPGTASVPAGPVNDPLNLLDLLPKVDLPTLGPDTAAQEPSSPVRGFFDRLGGWLDTALGWVL